jgi:hypothetical protein
MSLMMIEGNVPTGWSQADHDEFWRGYHAGVAHAVHVEAYGGDLDDDPAKAAENYPVSDDPDLRARWEHGYQYGRDYQVTMQEMFS